MRLMTDDRPRPHRMSADELDIRRLVEAWAVCRDGGDWDALAEIWHPGGTMRATWFAGPAPDFIAASRAGFGKGVNVNHFLGGSYVEIAGTRAVAWTKMSITQRTMLDGQDVDVVCTGRFVDLFRHDHRWGLDHRLVIYENDRIDPVVPGPPLAIDGDILRGYPPGYCHLAYAQVKAGLTVAADLPGRSGPALDALKAQTRAWLGGSDHEDRR